MRHLHKLLPLIILLSFLSCEKKESNTGNSFDFNNSNFYFYGKVNNKAIWIEENKSSNSTDLGRIFPSFNSDSSQLRYNSKIESEIVINGHKRSIELVNYQNFLNQEINNERPTPDSIFRDIFKIANKEYVNNKSLVHNYIESGILIIWTDEYGVEWASAEQVENITNNEITVNKNRSFDITHSYYEGPHPQITINYIKIGATFNCVLYNINGDSIKIENGEFIGRFHNIYE